MKISTGLVPVVKVQRILKTHTRITLGHISGEFPVPPISQDSGEVWVVELRTAKDSKEHPKGTVKQVMILDKEPRVERRGVKLSIPAEEPKESTTRQFEHAGREHNIPDDAVVEEHWIGMFHLKEHIIQWYELEV